MSRLARPTGGGKAFRDLNNALHELHALASWPSLDEICTYLRHEDTRRKSAGLDHARLVGISRVNVSRLFSSAKLPKPGLLLAVVEYLAKRAYRLDVDLVCDRFDELWRRALSEQVPPAPGPDPDEDGPDGGPNPARLGPRGPRPSGGPTVDSGPTDDQPFSLLDIVDELRPSDPRAGQRPDHSARLLMVDLAYRPEHPAAPLTDRAIHGWSQALSIGNTTVAEQPTAAELRRRIAETLGRSPDVAVLWLRAPVIWDLATGEAHFVTRDSELDVDGTLWNTVSYTEIQYAIARSSARAVFVFVVAGRSSRIAEVYGDRTAIPVGRTQWAETLYATDDDDSDGEVPSASADRPVFLLWLSEIGDQLDYPGVLLQEIQSSTWSEGYLTAGALHGRLRQLADRVGQPQPYGVARHGGEGIVVGRWWSRNGVDVASPWTLRLAMFATPDDANRVLAAGALLNEFNRRFADNVAASAPALPGTWLRQAGDSRPGFAEGITVSARGRFAGNDVMVAAFADNSVRLLDLNDGRAIRIHMSGRPDSATALAIGAIAGRDVLAVAFADDSLRLWDADTGDPVQTLSHSIGRVTALAICHVDQRDFVAARNAEHRTWCWEVVPR
jgi:hypothetical protein